MSIALKMHTLVVMAAGLAVGALGARGAPETARLEVEPSCQLA